MLSYELGIVYSWGNFMRRIMVALSVSAAAVMMVTGCGDSNSPTSAESAADTTTVDRLGPNGPIVAGGLSCAEIGGVFIEHGTDGRGDCESADLRPRCHVAPADQGDHYVAGFTLAPPFPRGTVSAAQVQAMLEGASNADCWKMPG